MAEMTAEARARLNEATIKGGVKWAAPVLNEDLRQALSTIDTLTAEVERLRGMLEEAFLAGFEASGEGWNGEYPFEGLARTDERWGYVRESAAEYIRLSASAAQYDAKEPT